MFVSRLPESVCESFVGESAGLTLLKVVVEFDGSLLDFNN